MYGRNAHHFTKTLTRRHPFLLCLNAFLPVLVLAACGIRTRSPEPTQAALDPTYEAMIRAQRSPEVPALPFPDNPDPAACGIPVVWGQEDPAWLTGEFEGEMIQPDVFLYDSHLRLNVTARAPHGSQVTVLLYQQNPITDYYLVKIKDMEPPNEGWIPAPLLSFEPVDP